MVSLRVALLEGYVADSLRLREFEGAVDRLRGQVDTQRIAFGGHSCRLTGRLPSSASDVENVVGAFDTVGAAQHLVEQPQFSVVVHGRPARVRSGVPRPSRYRSLSGRGLSIRFPRVDGEPLYRREQEEPPVTKKARGEISRCDYGDGDRLRWSPIVVELFADGVDLADQQAVDEWTEAFNSCPFQERDEFLGRFPMPD